MNNISINISGKIDREKITILRKIKEVADSLGLSFFVIGAFARDVVFEHIHRIPAPRITGDIDIGFEVANWEQFDKLTDTLIKRELVSRTGSPHRFLANSYGTVIDIVPYGRITGEEKRITWPPEHDMIMSMLGFEEAYQSALKVRFSDEPFLEIQVPSVPALALLKIISWADAYPRRERDAQDLLFILENCDGTGIEDQLYESEVSLLAEEGYDARLASVRLLGQDIARLCSPEAERTITEILTREIDENQGFRMLSDMVKVATFRGITFENAWQLLKKLLQGIEEQQPKK